MNCDDWPIQWPCDISTEDEDLVLLARQSAQQMLWALSGRRFGICTTTEEYSMPCSGGCAFPWGYDFGPGVEWRLQRDYGLAYPRLCCRIRLSQTPVRSVDLVLLNGEIMDPADYQLQRGQLARLGECWPCEQECEIAPISVTYTYGIDVPALGQLALGELACELLAGLNGGDCRLPSNAIAVTRQGVTVDLGDAAVLMAQNRIGLPISDAFIRAVNPGKLHQPSGVYSPDLPRRVR